MSKFKSSYSDYAVSRHQRPSENYRSILDLDSKVAYLDPREGELGFVQRLKGLGSDIHESRSAFLDLLQIVFGVSLLLYLVYREPAQETFVASAEPVSAEVFSDELLDLTGLIERPVSVDLMSLKSLIDREGLQRHASIHESADQLGLQVKSRVLFNDSAYDIARSGATLLKVLLPVIKKQGLALSIEVHTDGQELLYGEITSEQLLSERRAQALSDYFIAAGIKEESVRVSGFGNSQPMAKKGAGESNSRVLFIFE